MAWSRDTSPANGIDDEIDASGESQFDIVVNFNDCVESSDVGFLSLHGTIQRRLKYISSVSMAGVSKTSIATLVADPRVAFVELQPTFQALLNTSVPNVRVAASATYSPNTVSDAFPTLNGSGVGIAIIDTGVDNTTHAAFAGTTFSGGYNAITQVLADPDDDNQHGTHVASIALGQTTTTTSRGVAPSARLIDVKVLDAGGNGSWNTVTDGLEKLYDNRTTWGVDVINMSLGGGVGDGLSALSQLVDLAESMGIVVVISAGNSGPNNPTLPDPAAATRAITVAASSDLDTVDRANDIIAEYSSRGPRSSDGDQDCIDELKPEVAAPGSHSPLISQCNTFDAPGGIRAARWNTATGMLRACGTSMAAPHVAGLAALIKQARPGINAASVKELIIATAEPRGTPSASSCDPTWNRDWGWGLVNAYSAIALASQTNMRFPSHPPNPIWLSPDISTSPYPPQKNQTNTVSVTVRNAGSVAATGIRIHLGAEDFTANLPQNPFSDIGTRVVTVPANTTQTFNFAWKPTASGHMCLKAEIAYGADTNYTDNHAQRNVTVAQSPVSFKVRNTLTTDPAEITFATSFAHAGFCNDTAEPCIPYNTLIRQCGLGGECISQTWTAVITPPSVTLAAADCPVDVQVDLRPPANAISGSRQRVDVAAKIGSVVIGGVSVDSNAAQTQPDPPVSPSPVQQLPSMPWTWIGLLIVLVIVSGAIALRTRVT
jgi:serine protease AprX